MTREALLRELRKLARDRDVEFEVTKGRGKGSHYRRTTIKSGELTPTYVGLVKKQLGV